MTTIMIDAGHGPETAGKRLPDGLLREFSFNSTVANLVKQYLIEEGLTVIFAHKAQEVAAFCGKGCTPASCRRRSNKTKEGCSSIPPQLSSGGLIA